MEITDVRVRLATETTDRLKAFCTVTFDDVFVVRDIKIVDGTNGLFIAMPSRKRTTACRKCRHRNQFRARYCEDCGERLSQESLPADDDGRNRLHRDIAHPITSDFRQILQDTILAAYLEEFDRSAVETDEETELEEPVAEVEEDEEEEAEESIEAASNDISDERKKIEQEYDDLIAGVKGRTENETPREQRPRKPEQKRDRDRPRRDDRPHQDRSAARQDKPATPKRVDDKKPAEPRPVKSQPEERKPIEAVSQAMPQTLEPDDDDVAFGAGIGLDDSQHEVSIAAETETPPETSNECEDTNAFGAGII